MTLDDLLDLQAERELQDTHLVYLGEANFAIAHTDGERAGITPLHCCALHQYLVSLSDKPRGLKEGVYIAFPHEYDQKSTSYGTRPWDFIRYE